MQSVPEIAARSLLFTIVEVSSRSCQELEGVVVKVQYGATGSVRELLKIIKLKVDLLLIITTYQWGRLFLPWSAPLIYHC